MPLKRQPTLDRKPTSVKQRVDTKIHRMQQAFQDHTSRSNDRLYLVMADTLQFTVEAKGNTAVMDIVLERAQEFSQKKLTANQVAFALATLMLKADHRGDRYARQTASEYGRAIDAMIKEGVVDRTEAYAKLKELGVKRLAKGEPSQGEESSEGAEEQASKSEAMTRFDLLWPVALKTRPEEVGDELLVRLELVRDGNKRPKYRVVAAKPYVPAVRTGMQGQRPVPRPGQPEPRRTDAAVVSRPHPPSLPTWAKSKPNPAPRPGQAGQVAAPRLAQPAKTSAKPTFGTRTKSPLPRRINLPNRGRPASNTSRSDAPA